MCGKPDIRQNRSLETENMSVYIHDIESESRLGRQSAYPGGILAYMWHKFAYYVHKPLLPNKSTFEHLILL